MPSNPTEYMNKYMSEHRERYLEKYDCKICGGSYTCMNKLRHERTKKHIRHLNSCNVTAPEDINQQVNPIGGDGYIEVHFS